MRVFVASTYTDLLEYRAAATRAILIASGSPEDMLYWPAEGSEPLEVSLRRLRASDLVILILAHSYGAVAAETEKSITEHEFDAATEAGIPMLAFSIDPEHPWPPKFVETDPVVRRRLKAFTERVEAHVTRQQFTTPESLEVALAHALTLAQLRSQEMSTGLSQHGQARLLRVARAESLYYSPNALIRVGRAPDGAPLVLDVRREISLDDIVVELAARLRKEPDDPTLAKVASDLKQEARKIAISDQIHPADIDDRETQVYMTRTPLIRLVAPSLFQSMLDSRVDVTREDPYQETHQATSISGIEEEPGREHAPGSLGGLNRFLCVTLDSPVSAWSGGWTGEGEQRRVMLWRSFIEEGLERLPGVRYVIERVPQRAWRDPLPAIGDMKARRVLDTRDVAEFRRQWLELLSTSDGRALSLLQTRIHVPRATVIALIVEVMDEVALLHEDGRIHGDLKPSNVLVSRVGSSLIDEVGLRLGEVSPTVSIGWSPPEQLLRSPLTAAADVFPLGEMLRRVIGAESLGRRVDISLPDGATAQIRENPTMYLAPGDAVVPRAGRSHWYRVIERALRFDPGKRWEHVVDMAETVRDVMQRVPVSGDVEVRFPWGDRPVLVPSDDGGVETAWLI